MDEAEAASHWDLPHHPLEGVVWLCRSDHLACSLPVTVGVAEAVGTAMLEMAVIVDDGEVDSYQLAVGGCCCLEEDHKGLEVAVAGQPVLLVVKAAHKLRREACQEEHRQGQPKRE